MSLIQQYAVTLQTVLRAGVVTDALCRTVYVII